MYTIYHIPGVKVGCTSRNPEIRVKEQGYDNFEILEVLNSIELADERESYWQKKYDLYDGEQRRYKKVMNMQSYATTEEANEKRIETCKNSDYVKESKIKILQLDYIYRVVSEYDSLTDAAKAVNRDISSIAQALKNTKKLCSGYRWKYKK
jgi:hypothetical protein